MRGPGSQPGLVLNGPSPVTQISLLSGLRGGAFTVLHATGSTQLNENQPFPNSVRGFSHF